MVEKSANTNVTRCRWMVTDDSIFTAHFTFSVVLVFHLLATMSKHSGQKQTFFHRQLGFYFILFCRSISPPCEKWSNSFETKREIQTNKILSVSIYLHVNHLCETESNFFGLLFHSIVKKKDYYWPPTKLR